MICGSPSSNWRHARAIECALQFRAAADDDPSRRSWAARPFCSPSRAPPKDRVRRSKRSMVPRNRIGVFGTVTGVVASQGNSRPATKPCRLAERHLGPAARSIFRDLLAQQSHRGQRSREVDGVAPQQILAARGVRVANPRAPLGPQSLELPRSPPRMPSRSRDPARALSTARRSRS